MFKSKMVSSLLTIGLAGVVVAANAQPLTIDNRSNHDSVAKINNSSCSSNVPGGITRAKTKNIVSERLIRGLCGDKTCVAEIYMSATCANSPSNPVIARVEFNVNSGLGNISNPINGYTFTKLDNFSIIIEGGPA